MSKVDELDYCFLTTRLRSLETMMLSQERMEMMLETGDVAEAVRILQECGYGEVSIATPQSLEESLAAEREKTFREVVFFAPNPQLVDVFRVKYDYHNIKALLKAEATGGDAANLLSGAGRVAPRVIDHAVSSGDYAGVPARMQQAVVAARELLGTTGDPQLADTLLDRAYYEEMGELAEQSESEFLRGYAVISLDVVNLRVAVRAVHMGKRAEFLRSSLFTGGSVNNESLVETMISGTPLEDFYANSALKEAAAAGDAVLSGGSLTQFERVCDNVLMRYLAEARFIPYGEQPIIFHLAAKEQELTAVRIIITGLKAGAKPDIIRERLREVYV